MRKPAAGVRLSFTPPLLPTLVDKPPEGDGWIHEVKFDGYRSQIVRDKDGVRIFTRRGLDWTTKYRDLVKTAVELNAESAIIDGEIVVLNEAGQLRLRRAAQGHHQARARPPFRGVRSAALERS